MVNPTIGCISVRNNCDRFKAKKQTSEGASLGIYGRTPAGLDTQGFQRVDETNNLVSCVDSEKVEISTFTSKNEINSELKPFKTSQQARAERWALKAVVNLLFPTSSTSKCSRWNIPYQSVRILKNPEYQKAHYGGLERCGSVWWCPLCASKIAERRRAELVSAVATARAMGWQVLLMTCTVPHGIGDDVNDIKDKMLKAWRKMIDSRAGKDMKKLLKIEGTIRAFEVTYGCNGFHPHFHILIFAQNDFTTQSFQSGFYPLWLNACVKVGLPPPSESHGLHVDDGSRAERYVTKWGLEDEMTKSHLKTSRSDKGQTPWDFLRDVLKTNSERSKGLFRVYANAFKGSRQLYWSNGLKAKLGVVDVSDEELAIAEEENSNILSELTLEQWQVILSTKNEASLLDLAERQPESINNFLHELLLEFPQKLRR